MSDVVVSVVESNTAVTVTEQDVAVDVTENNVVVSVSTAGIQGVPGANNDPTYVTVRNATGATLAKGTIVYISGANGNNVQVTPAIATGDSTSARTLGWLAADILNNGSGLCMVEGYLEGINTQGFTAGAQLYLSGTTAGAFTATKPVAPIHLVYVGVVTKVSSGDGHVFVKVQNGYEISELHDVLIVAPTNNQVLAYDSATQLWKNATNTPDGVTSITATAPLTGGTITSTGSIGLDQTALSITKSQVSDFTSGTVTSASTAQQAGTAVYSVNSGTAVFANTSGTATYATTSGTATYAETSGTATYATNSGTAVFATNASTAVTISGSITQSQVTNLTTDLAGKANLAGGNALTGAQTITSTAIGQVPLTLVGASGQTANLLSTAGGARIPAAGNYFIAPGLTSTFVADFNAGNATTTPVTIAGVTGQTANLLRLAVAGSDVAVTTSTGTFRTAGLITAGNVTDVLGQLSVYTTVASRVGTVIRGAAAQTAHLLQLQDSSGTVLSGVSASGRIYTGTAPLTNAGAQAANISALADAATVTPLIVRGAASQSADLFEVQNSSAVDLFSISSAGLITAKVVGNAANQSRGLLLSNTADTWQSGLYLRSDGSGFPRLSLLAPTGALGEAVSIDSAAKVGIGNIAPVAQLDVYSQAAARVGQVIRGAASQTADLFQVQDNAGTNYLTVNNVGSLLFGTGSGSFLSGANGRVNVQLSGDNIGVTVRAFGSQTADLLQFQTNTGSYAGGFERAGALNIQPAAALNGYSLMVRAASASVVPVMVRGAASQSADTLQVQNSSGTNLLRIDSGGNLKASNVATLNSLAQLAQANSGGVMIMGRATAQFSSPGANSAALYFRDGTTAGTLKLVVRAGAAGAETTILDNIPQ